ncbi:MAG: hypothetical protein OJF47_001880 [Nitrospira sp.]|nr:MAG: hypothetical protein OJF47_001880 [Nitrospira sp.]
MSWTQGVTRYQWMVLFVPWLGRVFEAMDAAIYEIVLHPALHDLLTLPFAAETKRRPLPE